MIRVLGNMFKFCTADYQKLYCNIMRMRLIIVQAHGDKLISFIDDIGLIIT